MEDKVFEFMEKMYADLKSEIKSVKTEINSVKTEINSVKTELKNEILKTNLLIEHDVNPKIDALLDGYKHLAEGQKEIRDELADIKEHLVLHDNEIALLKAER